MTSALLVSFKIYFHVPLILVQLLSVKYKKLLSTIQATQSADEPQVILSNH